MNNIKRIRLLETNSAILIQKWYRGYRDRLCFEALKIQQQLLDQQVQFEKESYLILNSNRDSPVRVSDVSNNLGWYNPFKEVESARIERN